MKIILILVFSSLITSGLFSQEWEDSCKNWKWGQNGWQLISTQLTNGLNEQVSRDSPKKSSILDTLVLEIQNVYDAQFYLFDLDSDGNKEYVVSCVRSNGEALIYIFDENGNLYPAFPFIIPRTLSYPARMSMYEYGKLALTYCQNVSGYLIGIDTSAFVEIPEIEVSSSVSILSREPVVADVTGDGRPDLVMLFGNAPVSSSTLVFFDPYSQQMHSLPLPYSQVTPAVGDIDGDGINEVVHETGMFWDPEILLWAFEGDGTLMSGWPKSYGPSTLFAGVFLADFRGDNRPEIILQLSQYTNPNNEYLGLLSSEGQQLCSIHFQPNHWGDIPLTALGKMNEIASLENPPVLILAREKWIYFINLIDSTVECVTLNTSSDEIKTFRAPTDNDSTELITATVQTGNNYSNVNIIDADRNIVMQRYIYPAYEVQVVDLTNNGYLDIVYSSLVSNVLSVSAIRNIYQYSLNKIEWPEVRHDFGRTCNYDYIDPFTPVELTCFTSAVVNYTVNLHWETATETNNRGFEVERKSVGNKQYAVGNGRGQEAIGNNWEKIGFVEGFGTTTEPKSYSFVDNLNPDLNLNLNLSLALSYRLKQIDFDGSYKYSNIVEVEVNKVTEFSLSQNYPNPFNPITIINYQLPINNFVTLKVYDTLGEEVAALVNEEKPAGRYEVKFDGSKLSSGVYFYQLKAGSFVETKKMMVLK